jgi:hypothetical protein
MKRFIASLAVLAIGQAFAVSSTADAASTPSNDPVHRYVVETAAPPNTQGKAKINDESVVKPRMRRLYARPPLSTSSRSPTLTRRQLTSTLRATRAPAVCPLECIAIACAPSPSPPLPRAMARPAS